MPQHKQKILLVEDDTFLSKMYFDKLTRSELFDVTTVESGQKAVELVKSTNPDLVLLDIVLPDINGLQVLKAMKQDDHTRGIPVLMLTNLNEKDYINAALSLGADGYLIKAHFTPNEVVDKIKQLLRPHSGEDA